MNIQSVVSMDSGDRKNERTSSFFKGTRNGCIYLAEPDISGILHQQKAAIRQVPRRRNGEPHFRQECGKAEQGSYWALFPVPESGIVSFNSEPDESGCKEDRHYRYARIFNKR